MVGDAFLDWWVKELAKNREMFGAPQMTTKVIVTVPEPNDKHARVVIEDLRADGTWMEVESPSVLIGRSREFYIHGYRRLRIVEG